MVRLGTDWPIFHPFPAENSNGITCSRARVSVARPFLAYRLDVDRETSDRRVRVRP
ncbi:hypothetical protein NOLU111490_12260 [Novosphingobium lubricantis]